MLKKENVEATVGTNVREAESKRAACFEERISVKEVKLRAETYLTKVLGRKYFFAPPSYFIYAGKEQRDGQ